MHFNTKTEGQMVREIKKVAIIGAGVMGSGIAAHLANAAVPVVLLDIVPPNLTDEEKKVKANRDRFAAGAVEGMVKAKGQIQPLMNKRFASFIEVGNLEDDLEKVADCDWVVEVVLERLDIKRNLFDRLIKVIKPGTIVTSNTSGISINKMIEGYPEEFQKNFMITHFFNPPRYMRLLELIKSDKTDPEVVETLASFGETVLGKGIVWAKDTPNFIANRIGVMGISKTFHAMVAHDLSIDEVDAVTAGPMAHKAATFKTADLVGNDTLNQILKNTYEALPNDPQRELMKAPAFWNTMIEKGLFGNKVKKGFYTRGKDGKQTLDWKTCEYKATEKVRADSLKIAKNTEDPGERLKGMVNADDKYGRFAWDLASHGFIYAATMLGEISDDVVNIDNGMKFGFNWDLGPFEQWDAVGVKESVARMKAEGMAVPAVVEKMLAKSSGTWYKVENGKLYYWCFKAEKYVPVPTKKGWFNLKLEKQAGRVIKKNSSASLIDLGDGVVCCEFHSKMNAIDDDITNMIGEGLDLVESSPDWAGMVVGNQGENFSVGANLAMIMMLAMGQQFDPIEQAVKNLQSTNQRMHYSSKPVVAAPFGMVLGGGVEVCLGASAIVAHAESYMGLVEIGAGLIPGGGGNVEMLKRYLENIPADMKVDRFAYVQRVFEQIGMAKVSLSAWEARDMKILRNSDVIVANRDELIGKAKNMVLGMYTAGYKPARKPDNLLLPGRPGVATFQVGLFNMAGGGFVTEYEKKIATKLAWVLCGGDIEPWSPVSEQYVLDLEREQFMSLVGEPKTIERMQSLLTSGKPLRN